MEKSLQCLAELLQGEVAGDGNVMIGGLAPIETAREGELTYLSNPKHVSKLAESRASAVLVAPGTNRSGHNAIVVHNPRLAFAKLLTLFTSRPRVPRGIMKGAVVGEDVAIGKDPSIHTGAVIGERVTIGDRVTLHPNVTLYDDVVLGDDVTLHSGVSIREGCRIGNRVIIHNATTIGSDGFGYVPDGSSYVKVPQVGIVVIEDDVEIGANSAIDRAALGATRIGRGTKIDNLVQVAHNCIIGEDCIIVGQAGLAGSTKLGKHVTLGGQVAVADHLSIGDNAMISGQSGVMGNVAPGDILSGTPAISHQTRLRAASVFPRLPEMRKTLTRLGVRMESAESRLEALKESTRSTGALPATAGRKEP